MQIVIINRLNNPPYLISPNFHPKLLDSMKEMLYNQGITRYVLISSEKENLEYEQFFKRHN
jgi:hypothetical protein